MSKYRNKPCDYDGHHFDSMAERDRYIELKLMQDMGVITGLELQKTFVLIPAGKYASGKKYPASSYIADFVYWLDGEPVVEDVKGFRTREFVLKKKLMWTVYKIEVQEVKA